MKVAIASTGNTLSAQTDPRFGRCAWFAIVDTDTGAFEAIENPGIHQAQGAGIAAAQTVANAGAQAVVASRYGPNAAQTLAAGGIRMYAAFFGTVEQAVTALREGRLPTIDGANAPAHSGLAAGPVPPPSFQGFGPGMGMGAGRGGRRGGGMGRGQGRGRA